MKKLMTSILAVVCLSIVISPLGSAQAASAAPTAGTVTTESTALIVRSEPSSSSASIATVARGSYITLYEKSGSWWHVGLAGGKHGYCYASYITPVSGSTAVQVTATSLNIRSGPSTSYGIQTALSKGTTVVKLSTSGSFAKILYDGTRTGYASLTYLGTTSSGTGTQTLAYPAISLSVPSYKQTDSRWANTLVGSSGRTIADIGCATTAVAMMESYRTKSTITPDTMENKLQYTSGGALYWPSNYLINAAMSYSDIYALLKSGKPVIVGAKTSSGSTHFVVVKGYAGGNSLTAAGFTINDPGSNSRTTLAQYLTVYPSIFRTVYYQ